jgi:glycosyltransferase involved in cell wall biosynthesis
MKISVVIPTKNRAEILKRSLGCAVSQTYPVDEIIVADNNSKDNTKEVIESFNDKRIKHLYTNKDINITKNWLRGINATKNDWIKIIYDDDWVEDTFVEKTVPLISEEKTMIHTGGTVHFFEQDIPCCVSEVDHNIPAQVLLMQGLLQVNPVGALIKKSAIKYGISVMHLLDKVCINSGIGPDVILLYAATTQNPNSWVHTPEALAHYDGRHGSLSVKTLNDNPKLLDYCYSRSFNLLDKLWLDRMSKEIDLQKYL